MHRIYESMKENHSNDEIFNKLNVVRYCCKRMFLSHINYFDMHSQYDKASFPFIKSTYNRRARDGDGDLEPEGYVLPSTSREDGEERDDDDDLLLLDRNDEDEEEADDDDEPDLDMDDLDDEIEDEIDDGDLDLDKEDDDELIYEPE